MSVFDRAGRFASSSDEVLDMASSTGRPPSPSSALWPGTEQRTKESALGTKQLEWIWEFLLKNCTNGAMIQGLLDALPFPHHNQDIERMLFLRALSMQLSAGDINDLTLDIVTALGELRKVPGSSSAREMEHKLSEVEEALCLQKGSTLPENSRRVGDLEYLRESRFVEAPTDAGEGDSGIGFRDWMEGRLLPKSLRGVRASGRTLQGRAGAGVVTAQKEGTTAQIGTWSEFVSNGDPPWELQLALMVELTVQHLRGDSPNGQLYEEALTKYWGDVVDDRLRPVNDHLEMTRLRDEIKCDLWMVRRKPELLDKVAEKFDKDRVMYILKKFSEKAWAETGQTFLERVSGDVVTGTYKPVNSNIKKIKRKGMNGGEDVDRGADNCNRPTNKNSWTRFTRGLQSRSREKRHKTFAISETDFEVRIEIKEDTGGIAAERPNEVKEDAGGVSIQRPVGVHVENRDDCKINAGNSLHGKSGQQGRDLRSDERASEGKSSDEQVVREINNVPGSTHLKVPDSIFSPESAIDKENLVPPASSVPLHAAGIAAERPNGVDEDAGGTAAERPVGVHVENRDDCKTNAVNFLHGESGQQGIDLRSDERADEMNSSDEQVVGEINNGSESIHFDPIFSPGVAIDKENLVSPASPVPLHAAGITAERPNEGDEDAGGIAARRPVVVHVENGDDGEINADNSLQGESGQQDGDLRSDERAGERSSSDERVVRQINNGSEDTHLKVSDPIFSGKSTIDKENLIPPASPVPLDHDGNKFSFSPPPWVAGLSEIKVTEETHPKLVRKRKSGPTVEDVDPRSRIEGSTSVEAAAESNLTDETRRNPRRLKRNQITADRAVQDPLPKVLTTSRVLRSLMERNATAHTAEWGEDEIENSPSSPSPSRQTRLSPPITRHRKSPLKSSKTDGANCTANSTQLRRKHRRWTEQEVDILKNQVKKYGKGRWKLVLEKNEQTFEGRTEVDLKDKWRNLERFEGIFESP